eukprot:scaffold4557_cov65-Phaeocystis_antarctica.AAC.5
MYQRHVARPPARRRAPAAVARAGAVVGIGGDAASGGAIGSGSGSGVIGAIGGGCYIGGGGACGAALEREVMPRARR